MVDIVNDNENPLLAAALDFARRGWRVLPLHSYADGMCTCENPKCTSPAKHPLTPNGVHGATTDEATIRRWWTEAPTANVGIATGNGLLVLDNDAKHGGNESLALLEAQHGPLAKTPTVATGGGGGHRYLSLPPGVKLGNKAGLMPGIDLRGDNGYVVVPPSLHASGQRYEWTVPPDTPPAPTPPWLLEMANHRPAPATTTSTGLTLKVEHGTDDFANHPGVGEGQRNAVLCKLIGVHLARGDDPEAIEGLAVAWAERCTPPMDEAEVVRTLNSLAAKHKKSSIIIYNKEANDDLDAVPLPEPPQWPKLDEAALYNLLGEIVHKMEPETEADPFAILLSVLLVFGNAVGRGPYFQVEGDQHHANLFAVMVGESSRGRKGTSLGRTLSLFEKADPEWKRDCHTTGLSSGEGLIWAVRDPVESLEPVKEKGKITGYQNVVKDKGVTDKRLLVLEPEFAQTLKVLRREGNTLSPIVRQGWDSGCLTAMTKNNFARATDTHISILGHITRPELAKNLCDTDCFNGFANRFLWALVRRSKLLPDGGNGLDVVTLQERLATALAAAKKITTMSRSQEARALWHQLYPELTAERSGLFGAVVGRGEAQTLRLSMLYALLDGVGMIDVPHLQAATAVWRYCEASARIIFAEGQGETADPLEQLLLQKIREEAGVNRRGLHKAIGGHVPAKEMVHALARLRDRGQVRCEMIATGGRPSECWFPAVIMTKTPITPPVAESPVIAPSVTETPASASQAMTLMELFAAVKEIGGQLRRERDGCVVDAPAGRTTPAILASVAQHQTSLITLLPAWSPVISDTRCSKSSDEMPAEEFFAELQAM